MIKYSLSNSFLKNVLMITSGTAFAQILSITLLPIITRLYTPEEYGVISIYAAVLGVSGFLGSLNYEMGIPIEEDKEKAINLMALSLIILLTITSTVSILFIWWGEFLLRALNGDTLIDYKYFIPIGIFFLGLYNIFTQWAYRIKDFKTITKTKFSQAITQNLITITFGLFGKGSFGLILGKVSGQSTGITNLIYNLIKEDKHLFKKINYKEIILVSKRYINFPLYTTPRRFLGDVSISLPILFITSMYGTQVAGLFGLANSIIQLPMNLIGTSVSNVFYAEGASLKNTAPSKIKNLSNNLLKKLVIIGLIPLGSLILFGPLLFSLVFGEFWRESGVYASILSLAVFSRFIFKPISNIFDIFERQKTALMLNVLRVILVISMFGVSYLFSLNSYWTIGLYSIVTALIYFLQYILAQKIINFEIEINNENYKSN
jgi:O-antigen/teichoic acid export membrane protein